MSHRIARHGKQVMMDGEHLCDARDDTAAEIIAHALTYIGLPQAQIPKIVNETLRDFFE